VKIWYKLICHVSFRLWIRFIVLQFLDELDAPKSQYVSMTGHSSYNSVSMTTQQRVANDDVISVGGDTFYVVTTDFDVSQRNQATTEDELQWRQGDCGTLFLFHEKLGEHFGNSCCM
jgi:hypothetical protein